MTTNGTTVTATTLCIQWSETASEGFDFAVDPDGNILAVVIRPGGETDLALTDLLSSLPQYTREDVVQLLIWRSQVYHATHSHVPHRLSPDQLEQLVRFEQACRRV